MKTLQLYIKFIATRLLFVVFALLIISVSYFPQFKIVGYTFSNPFYTNDENMASWLYYINYVIMIFLIGISALILLIIIYTLSNRIKEKLDDLYATFFVKKLFLYLYSTDEIVAGEVSKQNLKAFKKSLKNEYLRIIFIETLLKIHQQTTGVLKERTALVFHSLKYNYLIKAYLNSPYVRHKLFALKTVSVFQLPGYDTKILNLANSSNEIVRSEAIVTLLKLRVYEDLLFLEQIKLKLTLWNINIIIKTILELDKTDIHYKKLIKSETPEIATIGIILARLHKKSDFKNDIINLIGNKNEMLNEEAFLALISFSEHKNDFELLIEKIEMASPKAQAKIIQSMKASPDKTLAIQFLNEVVNHYPNYLKTEALRILLDLDLNSVIKLKNSADEKIRISCLQVLDINL